MGSGNALARAPPLIFRSPEALPTADFFSHVDWGYFRQKEPIVGWASPEALWSIDRSRVHSALVTKRSPKEMGAIENIISSSSLRKENVKLFDNFIGGGCMLVPRSRVSWWVDTFRSTLKPFLEDGRFSTDDQVVLAHAIFSPAGKNNFRTVSSCEKNKPAPGVKLDPLNGYRWFPFRQLLSGQEVKVEDL